MRKGLYFVAFLSLLGLMGCSTEKQYPGGDNDDRRKAPAASTATTPATAASPAAPADNSREKPGSGEAGGK